MNASIRFFHLIRPHWMLISAALVLTALGCLFNFLIPISIQRLIDHRENQLPYALPVVLLSVFVAQAFTNMSSSLIMGRVGINLASDLRLRLYARLQQAKLSFLDKTPAGAIISRIMDDVTVVQGLVSSQAVLLISDFGMTLVIAACLASVPRLFLVVALLIPAYIGFFRFFTRRIRAGATAVRNRLDEIFARLKQKFDGALVIKAHAREEDEIATFAAQIAAAHHLRLKVERTNAAFSSINSALTGVGACVVFAIGAWEAAQGRMTPGEVISAAALAALLFAPATRLADVASVAEQAAASLDRLDEVLGQTPAVAEPGSPVTISRDVGAIEFDHVSFGYDDGALVINDVCLRVEPGAKVAIVGPTGSGKTTLLNLLLRFYDPAAGDIRIGGTPLRQLALSELRRMIGVVPQEAVVFRGTVADNIRYGASNASENQIIQAVQTARLEGLIQRLPHGLATIIGEGGFPISQGERQQIAIARAVCKNPALVILDEATSCLDAPSEALIQSALTNLMRGRTSFIIAHRFTSVMHADMILAMQAGRIVQTGNHDELMAQPEGLYRRLYESQFEALEVMA